MCGTVQNFGRDYKTSGIFSLFFSFFLNLFLLLRFNVCHEDMYELKRFRCVQCPHKALNWINRSTQCRHIVVVRGDHDYAQHVSAQRQKLPFSRFSAAERRELRGNVLRITISLHLTDHHRLLLS